MIINRVYIKSFGGISDREYILSDGLNVIFGENESGKSTFLSFIRFMFYGAKKSRGKELSFRDRYMPWNGQDMCGEVEFTLDGSSYSLSRTVSASGRKKDIKLINKTTGDIVECSNPDEIGIDFFKMSEQSFLKTMFIGSEGTKIDSDGELLSKISNVSKSGDESISYQAVCDEINDLIADISSPRRSKAIIPQLEKNIYDCKEKLIKAKEIFEQKSQLENELSYIKNELDNALSEKERLTKLSQKARQYEDYTAYEISRKKLDEAEKSYKDILAQKQESNHKYDFLKVMSENEEEMLLSENSAQFATDKIQAVILNDKLKSTKTFRLLSGILGAILAISSAFYPVLMIGAFICVALIIYFFLSASKLDKSIKDIEKRENDTKNAINDILRKYNLVSVEHFKNLKREYSNETSRVELENSKIKMAKVFFLDRKAEHDNLYKQMISKYGSINLIEYEKAESNEIDMEMKINLLDQNILRFTVESAKIKNSIESSENILYEISSLQSQIMSDELLYKEAKEKLDTLELALSLLGEAYEEMKSNFAPKLARATVDIFKNITGGKYGELIVNDSFEIQIKKDGKYENAQFFSSGTNQQLYFSLRLGIIELTMGNAPLFIDDAFITYDDARFNNAVSFLNDYSKNNQIIFCTCHLRESNMDCARMLKF